MANYAQTSKNFTGAFMTGIEGVNTGVVVPWGSLSIPSGFLECNGQAVSRSTYAALFAVISTTYGSGDGTTTFNVPDLTDRTIVNKSNTKSLAQTGGANTVAQQGNVSLQAGQTTLLTAEIAAHTHTAQTGSTQNFNSAPSAPNVGPVTYQSTGGGQSHSHTVNASTFSGGTNSVLQPYLVLLYIIKT